MKRVCVSCIMLLPMLTACSERVQQIWDPPELSPVAAVQPAIEEEGQAPEKYARSDWMGGPADYFRDDRARQVGDLVTVNIEIDDKADFNNSSDRSRTSKVSSNLNFDLGILALTGNGQGKLGSGGESSTAGQGSTGRSEKLSVALAASVQRVLPNGHLLIVGSQEVLVNAEKRVLRIEGIVDPKDISRNNSVSYDRIAEARIAYGGTGDASTTIRPGWAQQAWDKIAPF